MGTIAERYAAIQEGAQDRIAAADLENKIQILVGLGTCGIAAGGRATLQALEEKLEETGIEAEVIQVGCIGMCFNEPLVDITKPGRPRISYGSVTPERVREIVDSYLVGDDPRPDLAIATIDDGPFAGISSWNEMPFYKSQTRRVLRNCGFVDPEKIDDYVAPPDCAAAVGQAFQPGSSGISPTRQPATRSTWSAISTRATQAHS
jgi:(2Fe-2S) ferredoxin